jgi:hypothetical protein
VRVTIQNGATHGLSRDDVERLVPLFPSAWSRLVKSIVLYQSSETGFSVSFYPKEGIIGLFWPPQSLGHPSKSEAIEDFLVAMAIVAERGVLPERISKSLRSRTLDEIADVSELCLAAAEDDVSK